MKKVFVSVFFLLIAVSVYSIDIIIVGKKILEDQVLSKGQLEILEDPSSALKINDILKDSIQKKFIRNTESYAYNKNRESTYWEKLS